MMPNKMILSTLFLAISAMSMGQQVDRLGLTDMDITRQDSITLDVAMTVKPSQCRLGRDQLLRVTPVLRSSDGRFEKELPSYFIAGKNQYYYTIRSGKQDGDVFRAGSHVSERYSYEIPWQDWMGKSSIDFKTVTSACCGTPVAEEDLSVVELDLVPPVIPVASDLEYIEPVAKEVKEYKIEGRAYVNFPVNRIEIFSDYLNNPL